MKKIILIASFIIGGATSGVVFAATVPIDAGGSCNYGQVEVEQSVENCWAVYQTATYNSSQQVNTTLSVQIMRNSAVLTTQNPLSFSCAGGCYYPVNTRAILNTTGVSTVVASNRQQSNTGYINTGSTAGSATITFETYLVASLTCGGGNNYCLAETPSVAYAPFTVTSASVPCVRIAFGTPPTPCQ